MDCRKAVISADRSQRSLVISMALVKQFRNRGKKMKNSFNVLAALPVKWVDFREVSALIAADKGVVVAKPDGPYIV